MIQYNLVNYAEGKSVVTAFIDGEIYTLSSDNAHFDDVVETLAGADWLDDPEGEVADLFDVANGVRKAFEQVTDRVTVENGIVKLDGTPVEPAFNEVVVKYLHEDNEGLMPLVRFLERLDDNPSFRSREQFWRFVERNGIHIDDDGYVILYKSVLPGDNGGFKSVNSGTAYVNGVKHTGQIPSDVGDVVSMPRREISDDPTVACHAGLHCGARSYAEGFFGGPGRILITVRVDPAHVVAVPTDEADRKVRVEQYEFMDVVGDRQVSGVRWASEQEPRPATTTWW